MDEWKEEWKKNEKRAFNFELIFWGREREREERERRG